MTSHRVTIDRYLVRSQGLEVGIVRPKVKIAWRVIALEVGYFVENRQIVAVFHSVEIVLTGHDQLCSPVLDHDLLTIVL